MIIEVKDCPVDDRSIAKIMPPKGGKAKRGGKRSSGVKSPTKKPAEAEAPTGEQSNLSADGVGARVSHVCMYNVETKKFEIFPTKGYSGQSLQDTTGLDTSMPLTRADRLKEVEVSLTASVSYKVKVFLRFEIGK